MIDLRVISVISCAAFIVLICILLPNSKGNNIIKILVYVLGLFASVLGGVFVTACFSKDGYRSIAEKILEKIRELKEMIFEETHLARTEMVQAETLLKADGKKLIFIYVSGFRLSEMNEEIQEALREKDIDIFILDPRSEIAKIREEEIKNNINNLQMELRKQISFIIKTFYKISEHSHNEDNKTLSLYRYDTIPYLSGIILEKDVKEYYFTHHLFYKEVKNCPSVLIKKNNSSYAEYEISINKFLLKYGDNVTKKYLVLDNTGYRDGEFEWCWNEMIEAPEGCR